MMSDIEEKMVAAIPLLPGVYLFKDAQGNVLYIGKAKQLRKRVASYFQKYATDWKIKMLLDEYHDVDYIVTHTEHEALLLEAELIKQHKPKFNALLKEGQPFLYILFTRGENPALELVRNQKKKGTYFGPFLHKAHARKVYQYLVRSFQLLICGKKIANGCLDYHLGYCAGSCRPDFDKEAYLFRLGLAMDVLKRDQDHFKKCLEEKIKEYNRELAFEKAKHLVSYMNHIDAIFATINSAFSQEKYADQIIMATAKRSFVADMPADIDKQVQQFLGLDHPVRTIDCFDISHFQSKEIVGSCVRFTQGIPDKQQFRRFKIKTLTVQNDYAALQEIVLRRYRDQQDIPDLIFIDGGKGQLSAVQSVLPDAPCASIAKQEEIVYSAQYPQGVHLDVRSAVGKMLIALRDYAHHFAVSYHRFRRKKSIKS
ncbi:MAG TPA: GIY-YIG nuclease family protein [Candidatus Bathyarchaeia archaeon]|nr:GIY-YIG nuclease family protein [Candidatus Bathyarchaeia archaeon]